MIENFFDAIGPYVLGFSCCNSLDPWRVSDPSFLRVFSLLQWLTREPNSDMAGACPRGLVPPDCYRGPKWTPNGRSSPFWRNP